MPFANRWIVPALWFAMGAPLAVSVWSAEARPLPVADLRDALAVSKLAAQNKLPELSFRAARSALAGGPPIMTLQFQPGQLSAFQSRSSEEETYQQYVNEVEGALTEISGLWGSHNFPAEEAYAALASIVFPEGRSEEVFLYSRSAVGQSSTVARASSGSVAALLVDWAKRADRLEDLERRSRERAEHPRAKIEAQLLLIQLALLRDHPEGVADNLAALKQAVLTLGSRGQAEAVGQIAAQALEHPVLQTQAVELLEAVAQKLVPRINTNDPLEPLTGWLKAAAATRFKLGQTELALQDYQSILAASDSFYARYDGNYSAQMRQRLRNDITAELLRQNQLIAAFRWLGDETDLSSMQQLSTLPLAAYLSRQLLPLSAEERYDFLFKFTFPKSGGVRTLTGFVPTESPPAEFVPLLAPQMRVHEFRTLRTTPDPATFHSGAALLDAARACGRLPELLDRLRQQGSAANAAAAPLMLLIEQLRGPDAAAALPLLEDRVAFLEDANLAQPKRGPQLTTVPLDDLVVALYAMDHPALQTVSERLLDACLLHSKRLQQPIPRIHIWAAYVEALRRRGESGDDGLQAPVGLRDWRPASFAPASTLNNGSARNWWFAADGVVRNIVSESESALIFRYPLAGEFAVTVSIPEGGWSEGGLLYGGLLFTNFRYNNQINLAVPGREGTRRVPGLLLRDSESENISTLAVRNGEVRYLVNGHAVFRESPGAGSPWLGLRSTAGWTPTFRSLHITGKPQIPREVRLLDDPRMLGWSTNFYAERARNALVVQTQGSTLAQPELDWSFESHELRGLRRTAQTASTGGGVVDSLLACQRPMWDGEQIRYRFFYEAGRTHIHPALDRLVFLLQPEGVRLHWLTEGSGSWIGLARDNVVDDPAGQQHQGRLPLKESAWNGVTFAIVGDELSLTLNDEVVYRRQLSPDAPRRFGFYHHREQEAVRVRDVVLSGDWPHTLPADFSHDPFARVSLPSSAEREAARVLISEPAFARDALPLVRRAAVIPAEDRWEVLLNWVFPGSGDILVRMHADFVASDDPLAQQRFSPVVAPALQLVQTAVELGRLPELENRLKSLRTSSNSYNERSRLALLSLVSLARERPADARETLLSLAKLLPTVTTKVEWERWPEVVAAGDAILHAETRDLGVRLLDHLVVQQLQKSQTSGWRFDGRIRSLRGTANALAMASTEIRLAGGANSHWRPVTHAKAETIALGISQPLWIKTPAGFAKLSGHEDDCLYFGIPLQGDFTVDAELSGFGYREASLMYGGRRLMLNYTRKEVAIGDFLTPLPTIKLPQEIKTVSSWIPYRLVVRNQRMTVSIAGQTIYDEPLPPAHDPWLAIHSHVSTLPEIRHVAITGNPRIPDELNLVGGESLHGWIATYYRDNAARGNNPEWQQVGAEIHGRQRSELSGTGREALLQYHRPLCEDGLLKYRFRYVPGELHVHPALGRTVFLLKPEGVQIHRLTGGVWENSGLSPFNAEPLADSSPVPLKPNEENEVGLTLAGDELTIALNGVPVYQGRLPDDRQRLFGLFHYPGETGVVVKDVVYRGQWPRELPPPGEQEGAEVDPEILAIDKTRYPQSLDHDFGRDGWGQNVFRINGTPPADRAVLTPAGLVLRSVGAAGWSDTQVGLRRQILGDFDFQAEFDELVLEEPPAGGSVGMGIALTVRSPYVEGTRFGLRLRAPGVRFLELSNSADDLSGKRSYLSREAAAAPAAGVLRVVRRGGVLYYFVQTAGENRWRYFDSAWIGSPDQPIASIALQSSVNVAPEKAVSVRWKAVRIHAASILAP